MSTVSALRRRLLWRWRGNPLRRRSDTVEAWAFAVTWILGLVGACVCALFTAHSLYALGMHEIGRSRVVEARLLSDTRSSATGTIAGSVEAAVRWKGTDGHIHTGTTAVSAGRTAGSTVDVWVGPRGNLLRPPVTRSEATTQAWGGAVAAATGWGLVVAGGGRLVRACLDRGRMSAWEADWRKLDRQHGPR